MVNQTFIGVDVSKNWLDVWEPRGHSRIAAGAKPLAEFAVSARGALVVFEASGGYERPLMEALAQAGIAFHRVNPRQAREFARATGRLAKTDRVDARVLAQMGAALRLAPQEPPTAERQRLAELLQTTSNPRRAVAMANSRLRHDGPASCQKTMVLGVSGFWQDAFIARVQDLRAMRRAEKNRLRQAQDRFVSDDLRWMIDRLEARIARLEAEVEAQIAADPALVALHKRLQTMPGIGPWLSAELIAGLPELGQLTRRQIASLAGLAPHAADSGLHRGKRRIWGGRKAVRRALYL